MTSTPIHPNAPINVTICGPNLNDQSKGQMHVHLAGCADLRRGARREPEYANGWTIEASSLADIAEAIYADHMAEDPDHATDLDYWLGDIWIAPCIDLPHGELGSGDPEPEPAAPVFRTATGQTGRDAYQYEAAQIANEYRALRERMAALTETIEREAPELTVPWQITAQSSNVDRYPLGTSAHLFTVSQADDLAAMFRATDDRPYVHDADHGGEYDAEPADTVALGLTHDDAERVIEALRKRAAYMRELDTAKLNAEAYALEALSDRIEGVAR